MSRDQKETTAWRAQLDRWGEELYACTPQEDARRQALCNSIFLLCFEHFGQEKEKDALTDLYLTGLRTFDPAEGSLSNYLQKGIKNKAMENRMEEQGLRRVTRTNQDSGEKKRVWENPRADPVRNDEGVEINPWNQLPDENACDPYAELRVGELPAEWLTLMLRMPQLLGARAANEMRMRYFRMFFTDSAAEILHQGEKPEAFFRHERDVFRVLELPFLDFFLSNICRSLAQIAASGRKPYGAMVEGKPMDAAPKSPLPNDVYQACLQKVWQYSVSPVVISQQRKAYREFLAPLRVE